MSISNGRSSRGSEGQIQEQVYQHFDSTIPSGLNDGLSSNAAIPGVQSATVLVADQCSVTRRGIRSLVESEPGWRVVAEASGGHEAVARAVQFRPDLVILSMTMKELNGADATRLILKAVPQARVLVLTSLQTEEMIERALQAGVRGYVLKSDAEADLVAAVRALLQGGMFFNSIASDILVERLQGKRSAGALSGLTIREAEIVQLLVEGHSNKETAAILNISTRTVENHRAQVMRRLGLRAFSELIRYSIRIGIVEA